MTGPAAQETANRKISSRNLSDCFGLSCRTRERPVLTLPTDSYGLEADFSAAPKQSFEIQLQGWTLRDCPALPGHVISGAG
jgi:hypothetical protein